MELYHRVSKGTPLSNVVVMSNLTLNSGPINGINIKNAYHTICSCIRNTSTLNYIFQPYVLSLLLHLSLPFLCPGLLVRLLCRLYFKHLLREERSVAWKKPNRSLQGLRIIGKVKYQGHAVYTGPEVYIRYKSLTGEQSSSKALLQVKQQCQPIVILPPIPMPDLSSFNEAESFRKAPA